MEKYKVSARVVDITENTTLTPEDKYGAWKCVNQGTASAKVMGFELQPTEGLDFTNAIPAGSTWDTPIKIEINAGAVIRICRLQYKKV